MEEICFSAFIAFIGGLAALAGRFLRFLERRCGDLPAPALHFRLLVLPLIATVPLLLVIHQLASLDWEISVPLYVLFYVLGLPLILLGHPVAEFLETTLPMRLPSLDSLVHDALLALQWVLWGQLVAILIRVRRERHPTPAKVERLLQRIDEPFEKIGVRISQKYGRKQVEAVLGLAAGLLFILLVCWLVVATLRQSP